MDKLTGVIQDITSEHITVLLAERSQVSCGACALYDTCHSKEKRQPLTDPSNQSTSGRVLTVYDYPIGVKIGDTVSLEGAARIELKGAFWAFILPLAIVVVCAILLSHLGISDTTTSLILLGLFSLHGLALYLGRDGLKKLLYYRVVSISPCSSLPRQ